MKLSVKRVYVRFEDSLLFDPGVAFNSAMGDPSHFGEGDDVVSEDEDDADEEQNDGATLLGKQAAGRTARAAQSDQPADEDLPNELDPSRNKFAIGIKLKELSVATCDDNYEEVEETSKLAQKQGGVSGLAFKKVTVDGLSVFVDWMDNGNDCLKTEEERQENQKQWDLYQPPAAPEIEEQSGAGVSLSQLRQQSADLEDKFEEILEGEFSSDSQGEEAPPLFRHKYVIDNFHLEVRLQLNKDVKNPVVPASLEQPQIKAHIILGTSKEAAGRNDGALSISIFQPQLFRVMKTLEVIGFFNEFKVGALAEILTKRLDFGDQETLENIVETNTCL